MNGNVPPPTDELNAKELTRRRAERERVIFQEYIRVYHRCNKKITEADSVGKNEMIFQVPPHCASVPGYKQDLCEKVIFHKLVKNDFTAESLGNGKIRITWALPDFDEILREEEERDRRSQSQSHQPVVSHFPKRKLATTVSNNPFARLGNLSSTEIDSESDSPLSLDKIRTMKNYMTRNTRNTRNKM